MAPMDHRHQLTALISGKIKPDIVSVDHWPHLIPLAIRHGLGPMLFWTLKRANSSLFDHQQWHSLKQSAYRNAIANARFEDGIRSITRSLTLADIPALWIKGAALAWTVYPEPTLRPMADLDVLVPYNLKEKAVAVLQTIGYDFNIKNHYRPCNSDDAILLKTATHAYNIAGGIGNAVEVDLHFHLLAQYNDRLLPPERLNWFWQNTRSFSINDKTTHTILSPEAHLLYLCAHTILHHGEHQEYLMRYLDLHLLITRHELDWDLISRKAILWEWTAAVLRALEITRSFFSTPIPEAVFESLVQHPAGETKQLPNPGQPAPGERWRIIRWKLAHLSGKEILQYIYRSSFPMPTYMRERYGIADGFPVWPYYPYRWFDQALDMAWAAWKRISRMRRMS